MDEGAPRFVEALFPTHGPVPPEDVVGRQEAVETIAFKIRSGHHVIVAGPRRIGKSSVAGKALAVARADGVLPIEVDFFRVTTMEAFAGAMFDACAAHLGPGRRAWSHLVAAGSPSQLDAELRAGLGPFLQVGVRLHRARSPEELLDLALALPALLAEQRQRRVAILCDEFQEAGKLHPDFYRMLRHHASSPARVSYIFLGSRSGLLRSLFAKSAEPLYRAAFEVELPDADAAEWTAYLARKFHSVGIAATSACLDRVVAETGAHAQDTMLVADALYSLAYRDRRTDCTEEDAALAVAAALSGLRTAFAAEWDRLSADHGARIALSRIAKGEPVHSGLTHRESNATSGALRRLAEDGVIVRTGRGRYHIRERLFAAYLAATMLA